MRRCDYESRVCKSPVQAGKPVRARNTQKLKRSRHHGKLVTPRSLRHVRRGTEKLDSYFIFPTRGLLSFAPRALHRASSSFSLRNCRVSARAKKNNPDYDTLGLRAVFEFKGFLTRVAPR